MQKQVIMQQQLTIRWLLPILILLIMATVLVLTPAFMTHAAGKTDTTTPSATPAISTPAPSHNVTPNIYWFN